MGTPWHRPYLIILANNFCIDFQENFILSKKLLFHDRAELCLIKLHKM